MGICRRLNKIIYYKGNIFGIDKSHFLKESFYCDFSPRSSNIVLVSQLLLVGLRFNSPFGKF